MRRASLGKAALLAGIALAALGIWTYVSLPHQRVAVGGRWSPVRPTPTARGVYHIHTTRSDGTGSVDDVARAAGRARLEFIVVTDHGDGTRTVDPPRYVGNVLVIDAVEASTKLGHATVLGLTRATPYRLAGWPDDVVEDVTAWGGATFAAHPDSPRTSLSWRDWDAALRGFEWLNADSEWRDEPRWTVARILASYPWRPTESLASLLDRPVATLARWDRWSSEGRYLVTLAGADAHARLGFRDYEDEGDGEGWALEVPSYEQVFRTFSTVVELDAPLGEGAAVDAGRLIRSMAEGRTYTVIDGFGSPGRLEFFGTHAGGVARMGQHVPADSDVTFTVRARAPAGAELRLLRNGEVVARSTGLELSAPARTALRPGERGAAYRVEVAWPGAPPEQAPWMLSNAIFVEPPVGGATAPALSAGPLVELDAVDLRSCRVEKDQVSSGSVVADASGDVLSWSFHLAEATTSWVAVACTMPRALAPGEGLAFEGEASRPVRLDVQLREDGAGDHRWGRTAVLSESARPVRIRSGALRAVAKDLPAAPPSRPLTLLLVLDRTHGTAGMRGTLQVRRLRLVSGGDQVRTVSSR